MKYYTCANTSSGLVDFTAENIFDIETKVQFICSNHIIKNSIFEKTGNVSETIIYPGSKNITDGIICRNNSVAIVSKCDNPQKTVNLNEYLKIGSYEDEISPLYENMYESFENAKAIHDEWEKIYINNMDFLKLDNYCKGVINKLVTKHSRCGTGKIYKRFFGTSTVDGPVNYIDIITESIKKRYFIKGRPGTGKSTFLKRLSADLTDKNFDVEEYFCSFDPQSLDMVVCRELSICVFDSTHPHEKFPERKTDEILDFYVESGLLGVDEKFCKELSCIKFDYDREINDALSFFKKAWEIKEKYDIDEIKKIKESELQFIIKHISSSLDL